MTNGKSLYYEMRKYCNTSDKPKYISLMYPGYCGLSVAAFDYNDRCPFMSKQATKKDLFWYYECIKGGLEKKIEGEK